MQRLNTSQIIALGDYLKPDFNANSLTVGQLLGLLSHHDVQYPTRYTKPKLVELFNSEIKSNSKKLTKQRIKRENSQASEDGITDGVTGQPLNTTKRAPVRRSTRLSQTPAPEEPQLAPVAPPKRRRASAEPSLGGPSRRKVAKPVESTLVEESEPEEEPVVRKVGRPRKTIADAGTQARRVARPLTDDPESGWEDNNVFQSGAESSSPMRPSPVRPRSRKPVAASRPGLRSRKSLSAPPDVSSPPKEKGKTREHRSSVKPPESAFEPQLPHFSPRSPSSAIVRRQLSIVPDAKEEEEDVFISRPNQPPPIVSLADTMAKADVDVPTEAEEELEDQQDEEFEDDDVRAVAQRIAEGGQVSKHDRETTRSAPQIPLFLYILFFVLVMSSASSIVQYKQESSRIGFCDAGKSSNVVLDEMRLRRAAIESCNRENRTTLHAISDAFTTTSVPPPKPTATAAQGSDEPIETPEICPPPPLLPFLQADECTPCPKHATCSPSSITCENGFILKPHPVLAAFPVPITYKDGGIQSYERPTHFPTDSDIAHVLYGAISYVFDGLPLVGSVTAPPRCVEDPRRKRHIGVLGKAIESILANERGRRLCEGESVGIPEGDDAAEAQRWGIEVEKLREHIKEKTPPNMLATLDDTFNEAVQQLLQWGGVFMGEDQTGKRFLAHRTPVMSWQCTARVQARQTWYEWRGLIIGTLVVIFSGLLVRRNQSMKADEERQIAPLVNIALDSLRNQELAHHTDPVMVTRPYLSSLQLRDLVLQDVHDVAKRKRLWSRVERVVEGNANVRANLQEVDGGDEQRVWEWVGSAGKTLPPGTPGFFSERGEGGRIVA